MLTDPAETGAVTLAPPESVHALESTHEVDHTTVIYVHTDRLHGVPDYEARWDVPFGEVSDSPAVQKARADWEPYRAREGSYL